MVDMLINVSEEIIESSFTIQASNVMVENNIFSEGGMLENMAQTAAAATGYVHTSQQKEVPVGYIGAIKNINIVRKPYVGEIINTTIQTKNVIGNASIVEGKIYCQNELIANCELTIFVNN